jgi:hypothetical protein
MSEPSVPQAFATALEALLRQVRQDRSILAAVLCGSLSHDTVWEKSDIDLVLVTIDDRKIDSSDIPLNADGVNVHAMLIPRTAFRRMVEGSVQNSFAHAFLAKGRLLYTHDKTIADLCERLGSLGGRDKAIQMLGAGTAVLPALYKARKWFVTRRDFAYTSLWLLYAATSVARMEVIAAGLVADREVIPQAARLNPPLFKTIYTDLLREGTSEAPVAAALAAIDEYMASRARTVFAPVLEHLRETGDVRSSRDIEDHFQKTFGVSCVITACEYLADLGLIGKASTPVLLTRRSNTTVEELAFFYTEAPTTRTASRDGR